VTFGHSMRSSHAVHDADAQACCCRSASIRGSARGSALQHAQHPAKSVTTQSPSDAHDAGAPLGVFAGAEAHAAITTKDTVAIGAPQRAMRRE